MTGREPLAPEREAEIRDWLAELGAGKDAAGVGPYTALRDALAEVDRLRIFADATERRHTEIRALLAQLDIREGATAWNLGMAVLAILDGPPSPAEADAAQPACGHGADMRCEDCGRCHNCPCAVCETCKVCLCLCECGEPAGTPAALVASQLAGMDDVTAVTVDDDTTVTVQVRPRDTDGWAWWLGRFQVPERAATHEGAVTTARGTAPGGVAVCIVGHGITRLQAAAMPYITRRGGTQ